MRLGLGRGDRGRPARPRRAPGRRRARGRGDRAVVRARPLRPAPAHPGARRARRRRRGRGDPGRPPPRCDGGRRDRRPVAVARTGAGGPAGSRPLRLGRGPRPGPARHPGAAGHVHRGAPAPGAGPAAPARGAALDRRRAVANRARGARGARRRPASAGRAAGRRRRGRGGGVPGRHLAVAAARRARRRRAPARPGGRRWTGRPPAGALTDADGFGHAPLELTADGRDVLAGRADRAELVPVDRWVGGIRLQGTRPAWRWDRARGRAVDGRGGPG